MVNNYFSIPCILGAATVLLPLWFFNKYIFLESNAIFLVPLMVLGVVAFKSHRIPRGITFPSITFFVAAFIFYMWFRLGVVTESGFAGTDFSRQYSGLYDIGYQLLYYVLFLLAAIHYYNKGRLSPTLWLIICGYLLGFIVRNTLISDLSELREGHNLSAGYVVFTSIPFLFLNNFRDEKRSFCYTHTFFWLCVVWVFLAGSRTAFFALLIFYVCFIGWPLITSGKGVYLVFFFCVVVGIFAVVAVYYLLIFFGKADVINDLSLSIFQKNFYSRFGLWKILIDLVMERPIVGFGIESNSYSFIPPLGALADTLSLAPATQAITLREDLSSHSSYIELLIRLGFLGLFLYLIMLFGIWKTYWSGRKEIATKVAGSFLVATCFFMSTGEYLVFNAELRSAFGWIILGAGAGACLRARDRIRREGLQAGKV